MKEIVFVGTGSFIGASLRYITSAWFSQLSMALIYIVGSLVLGLSGIGLGIIIAR